LFSLADKGITLPGKKERGKKLHEEGKRGPSNLDHGQRKEKTLRGKKKRNGAGPRARNEAWV